MFHKRENEHLTDVYLVQFYKNLTIENTTTFMYML